MAGETRIIAFGANGSETSSGEPALAEQSVTYTSEVPESVPWDVEDVAEPLSSKWQYLAPSLAAAAILAWTAFYAWSQRSAFAQSGIAQVPAMAMQWAVPVLLVVVSTLR